MAASIRGHMGSIKVFKDGGNQSIVNVTKYDANQDSTFSRTFYVGKAVPEGDQTIEGWSGSIDCEVKNAEIDNLIDALVTDNLVGVGVASYSLQLEERYPDDTQAIWVFFDCQFKMGRSQGGLNEKVTKKLDFQASGRLRVK